MDIEGLKQTGNNIKDGIDTIVNFINGINGAINSFIDFFSHFKENVANFTLDLLSWIYEFISNIVLTTPLWLFDNGFISNTVLKFSIISIGVIIILTILEGIKQMLFVRHTKFKDIMKRLFIVLIGVGFSPFLFQKLFQLLNKMTHAITQIGYTEFSGKTIIDQAKNFSGLDTFALFGFDLILIGMSIPIILYNGRRWFDLLSLCIISPLAGVCFIFDQYRNIFNQWLTNVKKLSMIQLVYGIFITIIGLLIFSTKTIIQPQFLFVKLLIIIGGFWRLANPPQIVSRNADNGADLKKMFEGFRDAVTLKDTRKMLFKPGAGKIIKNSTKLIPGKIGSVLKIFKRR